MSDTTLQFTTRVDLAGAKAGFAELNAEIQSQMQEAAASVAAASASVSENFETQANAALGASAQAVEALDAEGAAASKVGEQIAAGYQQAITASTAEASSTQVLADYLTGMLEGIRAELAETNAVSSQGVALARTAVESIDIEAAAYKQLAAASLEAATARRQVTDTQNAYLAGELPAADAENLLAEAMERATGSSEQLALAKANLADVTSYLTTVSTEGAEVQVQAAADATASIVDSFAAQSAAAETSNDIQAAAYRQLATASAEAAAARRQVADAQAAYLAGENPDAENLMAEAMERSAGAAEQLALAKRNLAEVNQYLTSTTLAEGEAEILTSNQKRVNIGVTLEEANANEVLAASTHQVVSGQQAASAAIRGLEGNAGLRAVENFVAKTLGLGPLLQAIFPIVGAIAFGEVLIDLGEKVYALEYKTVHAAASIKDAFAALHDKAEVTNDDLAIQNDRLQDEIDKLSGHPNNGVATALDEARKMADQLLVSLQADRKELEQLLKENDISGIASALSGVANNAQISSTHQEGKELVQDQKNLTAEVRKAKADFETAVSGVSDTNVINAAASRRDTAIRAAFQTQIDSYKRESARLRKEQEDSKLNASIAAGMGGQAGALGHEIDNRPKIEIIEGRAEKLQDDLRGETTIESIGARDQKLGGIKQSHAGDTAAAKARREELKAIETDFADLNREKQLIDGMVLEPAAAEKFWSGYLATFKHGTDEYRKVLDETIKYSQDAHKQLFDQLLKTSPQQAIHVAHGPEERERAIQTASKAAEETARMEATASKAQAEMDKELTKQAEDLTHTGDRWAPFNAAVSAGEIAQIQSRHALEAANDAIALQHGRLTQTQADTRAAARDTAEYAAKMKILADQLRELEAASVTKKNGLGGSVNTDPQNASQIQRVKNEMASLSGAHAVSKTNDQSKITEDIAKPYLAAFREINTGWLKVQDDLIAGNKNIGQDFLMLGVHLVQWAASSTEQWLAKKLEGYIRDKAAHLLGLAAKKSSDTAANAAAVAEATATQTAITAAVTTSQLAQTGAVAAASAAQTASVTAAAAAESAVVSATDVAKVTSYAAVAGAAETAATLNPAAGAAMFATVEAAFGPLAAFEHGGIVAGSPGMPVPIVAHAGERVLSAPQTQQFERMVDQSTAPPPPPESGIGSPIHLHYSPTVHAHDRTGMRATLRLHSDDIVGIVRQAHQQGKLLA